MATQNATGITFKSEEHGEIPDDKSVAEYLLEVLDQRNNGKFALLDATKGESCTYPELARSIRNIAGSFLRRGLKQNDVVCFIAPNCIPFAAGAIGTNLAGGIFFGINPLFTESELIYLLNDASASVVATIPELLPKIENVAKEVKSIKKIYVIGSSTSGIESIEDLAKEKNDLPKVKVDPYDIAALFYSSGTTGKPKGTMLTNYNILANATSLLAGTDNFIYTDDESIVASFYPMYHIAGMVNSLIPVLRIGNSLITFRGFDFESLLGTIQKYKAKMILIQPGVVAQLVKDPVTRNYDLSSVETVISGSAKVSGDMLNILQKELNIKQPRIVYGLTEMSGVTHGMPLSMMSKVAEGAVGKVLPNIEYMIVDIDTGKELNYREQGEVWLRGPAVMKGYLNNPEVTAKTIMEDGWLRSGDIGYAIEDGRLFIVDRLKDMIKCQSLQVPPAELEDVLLSHPSISEVGVIGVPDEKYGEVARAFVVVKPGMTVTEAEIHDYMKERLAPYKQLLGGIFFFDELPRNQSGKILRRLLREIKV